MAKVINLNRFRKKKAKEEKERRAETNRRLHGRTKAERQVEALAKTQLEKKLDGAFLVPERVDLEQLLKGDAQAAFEILETASRQVIPISELATGASPSGLGKGAKGAESDDD